jgi:hypothetical protein
MHSRQAWRIDAGDSSRIPHAIELGLAQLEHRVLAYVGETAVAVHGKTAHLHHGGEEILLLHSRLGIAHGRVLTVLVSKRVSPGQGDKAKFTARNRVARRDTHIFETVQVLIPLAAHLAAKGLLFFHAQGSRVRGARLGVDDGESAIPVLMQLLVGMSMRLVVPDRGGNMFR